MLDLLIINPGGADVIYGELGDLVACEPPLWARLIAGYVRDRGFSVKVIDADAERLSPSAVAERVGRDSPWLVCIAAYGHQPSASTQQMVGAGAIARAVKARAKTPIIMVGGHVSALPGQTMREEAIDYACNGEGPETIVGLFEGDWVPMIPSLVWRDTTKSEPPIVINKSGPLLDLNGLHGNAWDLLPMHLYRAHNWQCFGDLSKRQPYASIYTSLGCPYACSFCCIQAPFSPEKNGNRYRMRDPADVVAEIKMLHDRYGVSTIKITDEMFILNERHYTAICEGIIAAGLGDELNIWAYARVDTVKSATLSLLRRAGIRWLALGIESGSKHVRDGADKALRNDDIVGVVRAAQAAGIYVIGNYIFGLPDETHKSMQETLDLAMECKTEFANMYCAMAYPGSRLYDEAVKTGAVLPSTWAGYSQHNEWCRPLDAGNVSAKEILRFRDEAFQAYFSNPAYLAMIQEKFGTRTVAHIHDMLKFKLRRKLLETA